MKRPTKLATLLSGLAAGLGATALPAQAAVSSASVNDLTATLNLDGADDDVIVSVSAFGGLLVHNQSGGGLSGDTDWDSATDGELPATTATTRSPSATTPPTWHAAATATTPW